MFGKTKFERLSDVYKSYLLLIICAVLACVTGVYLFRYTRSILHERLRERLIAISSTASLIFDENDINRLITMGEESVSSDLYRNTVLKLRRIKWRNPDIKYAYIFAKTDSPNAVSFVADADMIALRPELNYTEDEIDTEDWVGAPYDASGLPALREGYAFNYGTTDEDLYQEPWGMVYSSYAPITNHTGRMANTVLGIDVDVTSYLDFVNATLFPFIAAVVFLLLLIGFLTLMLLQMWGARVNLLKELDRQKDELISIVSHQLNTPVTSVKWNIEMMLDGDMGEVTEEQKKQLKSMQSVTTDLADLVAMMLDVSRIQLGRMKVDRTELNLSEFFSEILLVIDPKAEQKHQKLTKNIPADLPVAMLDKRLMRMTLENLLTNAVKYTPEAGEVKLHVVVKDKMLRYEVRDTGCGIPKSEQGKIFGKLFRASNVREVDGNGLGLFAAKGAVEAQGGSIRFESEEGKGTTFFVELPLVPPEVQKK